MTTKTNSTKVIRRVFIGDSNGVGSISRTFHAKDSIKPSTSGIPGLRPSTVGLAARNSNGTQGNSAGKRPIKATTAPGAFRPDLGGAAGNRKAAPKAPSADEIEAIKKAAFEKGVSDFHSKRVRDEHAAGVKRMNDWVANKIAAQPMSRDDIQSILNGG